MRDKENKKRLDKIYQEAHKEEIAAKKKIYRETHKEEIARKKKECTERKKEHYLNKKKEYYRENKERILKEQKEKYVNDINFKERTKNRATEYRKNNPEKKRKSDYLFLKNRRAVDPLYRLRDSISANIRVRISKGEKKTFEILGCSIEEYKQYLEKMFSNEMSWDNYGEWEIDHIIPISFYDLSIKENIYRAFNYRNTRPLLKIDNLIKSNSFDKLLVENFEIKDLLPLENK